MKKKMTIITLFTIIFIVNFISISLGTTSQSYYSKADVNLCVFTGVEYSPIKTYWVNNDLLCICAEDLSNYGFNVEWNAHQREVNVKFIGNELNSKKIIPNFRDGVILKSDIKIYIQDTLITSYNINGYSLISVQDFSKLYNKMFYGTMPSSWAVNSIIEASFNKLNNFITDCLLETNFQEKIKLSSLSSLICRFIYISNPDNTASVQYDETNPYRKIKEIGILVNCDKTLNENSYITKETMCLILSNTLKYVGVETKYDKKNSYCDSDKISKEAYESINLMIENGIISIDSNGLINPTSQISYEQAIVMLNRVGIKFGFFDKLPHYSESLSDISSFEKKEYSKNNIKHSVYSLNTLTGIVFDKDLHCPIKPTILSIHLQENGTLIIDEKGGNTSVSLPHNMAAIGNVPVQKVDVILKNGTIITKSFYNHEEFSYLGNDAYRIKIYLFAISTLFDESSIDVNIAEISKYIFYYEDTPYFEVTDLPSL